MGCGKLTTKCDDGFMVVALSEDEFVTHVQHHARSAHHKEMSRGEILKMGKHP